jgi:hypothetical protein
MIEEGTLPMNAAETQALANLNGVVSTTRRDPGETGPLVVHLDDGSEKIVAEDGTVTDG